jgi:hypothetical protein
MMLILLLSVHNLFSKIYPTANAIKVKVNNSIQFVYLTPLTHVPHYVLHLIGPNMRKVFLVSKEKETVSLYLHRKP